jgi:hypothetical protein
MIHSDDVKQALATRITEDRSRPWLDDMIADIWKHMEDKVIWLYKKAGVAELTHDHELEVIGHGHSDDFAADSKYAFNTINTKLKPFGYKLVEVTVYESSSSFSRLKVKFRIMDKISLEKPEPPSSMLMDEWAGVPSKKKPWWKNIFDFNSVLG